MALMSAAGLQGITLKSSERYVYQDNNGVERKFFKDDFSNNTIANYTVTGAPTIGSGVLTMAYHDSSKHTLDTSATTGCWDAIIKFNTSYVATTQFFVLYCGSSTYLQVARKSGNGIFLTLVVNGVGIIGETNSGTTLADATFGRVSVIYNGATWQMCWNGVAVGSATSGNSPVSPIIGVYNSADGVIINEIVVNEITYTPSVAFTDTFTADTEARYAQLSSTDGVTWTASAAGDVVVTGGKMTLASAAATNVVTILRSYNFASGEYEFAFNNNNDGGGGADAIIGMFCYQDILNHYRIRLDDDGAGSETLKFYKIVAGTATQLGSTKDVSATYTRGNKTWIKIHYSRETGQMWAYLRDDAGVYPTTPDISDAFSSQFSYGRFGYRTYVTTAGAGNLNVDFYPMTIRANLLIEETNVPAAETGFYFRDEFSVDSTQRWESINSTVITNTGGKLRITGPVAYGLYAPLLPFSITSPTITTKANIVDGNDTRIIYIYFGWDSTKTTTAPLNSYRIGFAVGTTNNVNWQKSVSGGAYSTIGTGSYTINAATDYIINIVRNDVTGGLTITIDGNPITLSVSTDTTYTNGKILLGGVNNGATALILDYDDLVISGTRYYMKPMLRGAQIGEYWNGTASVPCTRFTDDFNWDTSAEYIGDTAKIGTVFNFDTTNGYLKVVPESATAYNIGISGIKMGYGLYTWYVNNPVLTASQYDIGFPFARTSQTGGAVFGDANYLLMCSCTGVVTVRSAAGAIISSSKSMVAGVTSKIQVLWTSTGLTLYMDDINCGYIADTTYTLPGYTAIATVRNFSTSHTYYVYGFSYNALESTSTNGVAVTLPGVSGGGLYDAQSYAGFVFTNPNKQGAYKLISGSKSTSLTPPGVILDFKNTTDGNSLSASYPTGSRDMQIGLVATPTSRGINVDDLTFDVSDYADTLSIIVKRKDYSGIAYDNLPNVFVDPILYKMFNLL